LSDDRHSKAAEASLITDPIEEARRESENAVAQFDRVLDLIDDVVRSDRPFRLRPSMILDLHRIVLDGLSAYAGNYRPGGIEIGQSKHVPPDAHLVPGLIEEMCDHVTDTFDNTVPLHLCAYVMWRLNWIHPFTDGNGRTSERWPITFFAQRLAIACRVTKPSLSRSQRTKGHYNALEAADESLTTGELNMQVLEELLDGQLARQLLSAYDDAKNAGVGPPKDRKLH